MNLTIAKYLDLKIYNFFKTDFSTLMFSDDIVVDSDPYVDYSKIFFSTSENMKRRSFMIEGMTFPLTCLWRNSFIDIPENAYGKSVMYRDLYIDERNETVRCQIVDLEITYIMFSESTFLMHVNKVAQDMLQLDMKRYIEFDFSDYIDGYKTRVEFKKKRLVKEEKTNENTGSRVFTGQFEFTTSFTLPLVTMGYYIDKLNIYINGQKALEIPKD